MKTLAAGLVGAAVLVGGVTTATVVSNSTSTSAATTIPSGLGAPPVKIVSIGSDAIQVDYGPSQPGPFAPSNAKARSLKISWPASRDDLHPNGLKYSAQKNGKTINSALVNNYITVGFTTAVRSFRLCVKAVNSAGYSSPYGCTTFSGQ